MPIFRLPAFINSAPARLAGIPREVLDRAKGLLASLEEESILLDRKVSRARRGRPTRDQAEQLSLFAPGKHPALKLLQDLNVLNLTPLEALNKLSEVKNILEREEESRP